MRYYAIENEESILIANNQTALSYFEDVFELPEDYEKGKYIIGDGEKEIIVPDMETVEETQTVVELDDEGTPHEKEITVEVQKPVYETVEEEVVVTDENGETHTEIIETQIPKTHKETVNIKVLVPNPNWEEEHEAEERQRLDLLSLTKREVFLALYKDKGITPEQLRAQIQSVEAQIEFDYANDYYRGNPLINSIGALLGYTPSQLDYLFEHKEFEGE